MSDYAEAINDHYGQSDRFMKTSVVFPQIEMGDDPVQIKDFVQAVECMGYDCLHVPDMIIGANPNRPGGIRGRYDYQSSHHEVFVLLGYVAGLTARLELATGILVLPQRPTVLVAKQAAEIDVLSGGRLRLGVGVGETDLEMQALGYDFTDRGKRIEEQVLLLRELWTKLLVTFRGNYHTVDDMGIVPMPKQRPIPIWFGGEADVVIRRMARLGNEWMLNRAYPEEAKPLLGKLRGYLDAEGRNPDSFGIDIPVNLSKLPRDTWAQLVAQWCELGITYIGVNTMGSGFKSLAERLEAIELFKQETGL
jgi:probable F420-dependent oxidoreductase